MYGTVVFKQQRFEIVKQLKKPQSTEEYENKCVCVKCL